MAKIEDYLPGGIKSEAGGLDAEIAGASIQQQERTASPTVAQPVTPESVDWEKRYKDLEQLNSRQAQDLGTYRKMVDEYIVTPTPAEPVVEEESRPITVDDLYDNPDEAVSRAVESHPAIQEARNLSRSMQKRQLESELETFQERHPDYVEIGSDPAFRDWVAADGMRQELYSRGDQFDLSAADALFRLYKSENSIEQYTTEAAQQQQIAAASLEDSSSVMPAGQPEYSRSEYVDQLMRARQGDLNADTWVKRNAAGYRLALGSGNVRD